MPDAMEIEIYARDDARTYSALFTPVRTIEGQSIGWIEVAHDGATLRFPAIRCPGLRCEFLTVADWQAPFDYDLTVPGDVKALIGTGAGRFLWAKRPHHAEGERSTVPLKFARS